MHQHIGRITLIVKDYDEAINFYTQKLGFVLLEDYILSENKRWVLVAPQGAKECSLLLAKASSPHQETRIGDQTGDRVFLFLHTDDFWRDYQKMIDNGVEFLESPRKETYGNVVVFKDLYGNKWDLLGLNK